MPFIAMLSAAAPAAAEDSAHPFCTQRPGLGTSTCTLDPGSVAFESGIGWETDSHHGESEDVYRISDITLRAGISEGTEVQLGLGAIGAIRIRDEAHHSVHHESGVGDLLLGVRQRLFAGHGSAGAVQVFVTAPIGGHAFGAGDWGGGIVVPLSFELAHGVAFEFSPQVEAAVDSDRDGNHLAFGSVAGLEFHVSHTVKAEVEFAAFRDRDPAGRETALIAAAAASWLVAPDLQLDLGVDVGLNEEAADLNLVAGAAYRF